MSARAARRFLLVAALLSPLVAGCADRQAGPAGPASAVTTPAPPMSTTAPVSRAPVPAPVEVTGPTVVIATERPRSWPMPDLVGSNLQDAQNSIQRMTSYEIPITTSHDATGAGRQQLRDRNWKVCSQSVPPGASISNTTRIDFGAVRTEERCP